MHVYHRTSSAVRSSVTDLKLKAEYVHTDANLFYILHFTQILPKQNVVSPRSNNNTTFQQVKVSCASVGSVSEVRLAAMLLLLSVGKCEARRYDVLWWYNFHIKLHVNVIPFCQLEENISGTCSTYCESHTLLTAIK